MSAAGILLCSPLRLSLLPVLLFLGVVSTPGHGQTYSVLDQPCNPFGVKSLLTRNSFYNRATRVRALEMMRDVGLGWTSLSFTWASIEPAKDQFVFDLHDDLVDLSRAHGLRILAQLALSPDWATSAPAGSDSRTRRIYTPQRVEDFSDFVFRTVSHFKGRVRFWEIWNEPNNSAFFASRGQSTPSAAAYLDLLIPAYLAAKSADPDAVVVLGGLALNGMRESIYAPSLTRNWLYRFYQLGGASWFDVLNIHPFPLPDAGSHTEQTAEAREVMVRFGDAAKKMIIGEINGDMLGNGTNTNAASLSRVFVELLREEYIEAVFWYNFRNLLPGVEHNTGWSSTGLVTFEMNPKPAFFEISRLIERATRRSRDYR